MHKTVHSARELNISHGVFLNTMTGGTLQEQINRTAEATAEELIFYETVLFGEIEKVNLFN